MRSSLIILALMLVSGCATPPRPVEAHSIPAIIMVMCEQERIAEIAGLPSAIGAAALGVDIIWVQFDIHGRRDKWGNLLPDFEVLGHEVWHCVKGAWHE